MTNEVIDRPKDFRKTHKYPKSEVTQETLMNELSLTNLGIFEPLLFQINTNQYKQEIKMFEDEWVDYLPKTDRLNNRQGLSISNLPGKTHRDNPSKPQASKAAGKSLDDADFNEFTELYHMCPSIQPICDEFSPLGRTFIVRSNLGGYFPPHRDEPSIPRKSFRLVVFLQNCGPQQYDWFMEDDKKLLIEEGRVYYVNTRMTHRTISWINESDHMIMNIPMTTENVGKVIGNLLFTH